MGVVRGDRARSLGRVGGIGHDRRRGRGHRRPDRGLRCRRRLLSGSAPAARNLVADLSNDGYQGAILIASDTPSSVLRPLGSQADGVYVAGPVDDSTAAAASGGAALVFNDAYRAAFGAEPPLWSAEAYDATNILLATVASGPRPARPSSNTSSTTPRPA